jgi:uncharacterized protein
MTAFVVMSILTLLQFSYESRNAHEFLQAAQRCLREGWYNSAVNRAYYAMFQAARTALAAVGIDRAQWSHGALHATFATELIRRRKVYPLSLVHALTEAMERRHMADYSDTQISRRRATRTVNAAEDFVSRVMEERRNA